MSICNLLTRQLGLLEFLNKRKSCFIASLTSVAVMFKFWPNYRTKLDPTCYVVGCKCRGSGKTLSNNT